MTLHDEAIELIINKMNEFKWSENETQERELLRTDFIATYNKGLINKMAPEDYFLGHGRKKGCLAYDLEWTTGLLGSIRGGSKYKYGYEKDFLKIKQLLQKILMIDEKICYTENGTISNELLDIMALTKEINGFKTGRTVIPKLLSIYYPNVFLPIFNDQNHFIKNISTNELESDNSGLMLYIEYNFYLLKVKKKIEEIFRKSLGVFEFSNLLYSTFLKEQNKLDTDTEIAKLEDHYFDALEVQHYQTLLHRNFKKLFPGLRYFDDEEQNAKNGQYDTQTIGILDFLAVDEHGNFVVIEIKRKASDKTVGQILRYIGWVKEELCQYEQTVTGIIVAEKQELNLEFALKAIAIVKFIKLELNIKLYP